MYSNLIVQLNSKKELFQNLYNLSVQINCLDIQKDDFVYVLDDLIDKRDVFIEKIDIINQNIEDILRSDVDNYDVLKKIIKNSCDRSKVKQEYLNLFDLSQSIFSIIHKISSLDEDFKHRMSILQQEYLNHLKDINKNEKVVKYLSSIDNNDDDVFLNFKYNKI